MGGKLSFGERLEDAATTRSGNSSSSSSIGSWSRGVLSPPQLVAIEEMKGLHLLCHCPGKKTRINRYFDFDNKDNIFCG